MANGTLRKVTRMRISAVSTTTAMISGRRLMMVSWKSSWVAAVPAT